MFQLQNGAIIVIGQTEINTTNKPKGIVLALDENLDFFGGSAANSAFLSDDPSHNKRNTNVKCDPNSNEFFLEFNLDIKYAVSHNPGLEIGAGVRVTIQKFEWHTGNGQLEFMNYEVIFNGDVEDVCDTFETDFVNLYWFCTK